VPSSSQRHRSLSSIGGGSPRAAAASLAAIRSTVRKPWVSRSMWEAGAARAASTRSCSVCGVATRLIARTFE
jgi:hypothetical protein